MVGPSGFEPPTSTPPAWRTTKLCYGPTSICSCGKDSDASPNAAAVKSSDHLHQILLLQDPR